MIVSKDLCFGVPRLVQIDEHHSLQVQSWDCRRSLGLDSLSEPSPSARLQYLWCATCLHLVMCCKHLSRYLVYAHACLLMSFLMILGPGSFPYERIAMKQQSRSLAERR